MLSTVRIKSRGTRILISRMSTSKISSRRGPVLFVPPIVENVLAVLEVDIVKAVSRKWTPTPKEGSLAVEPLLEEIVPRAEVLINHLSKTFYVVKHITKCLQFHPFPFERSDESLLCEPNSTRISQQQICLLDHK